MSFTRCLSSDPSACCGRGRLARVGSIVLLSAALCGCAGTPSWQFVDEPGVSVAVSPAGGSDFSGTLVGYESGSYIIDRAYAKSDRLEVVRRDGRDIAYLSGIALGTEVEERDFDIVVRQKIHEYKVQEIRATTRAYFGWGTGIAAALTFSLMQVLEGL